jgi:fatty acid desaturase
MKANNFNFTIKLLIILFFQFLGIRLLIQGSTSLFCFGVLILGFIHAHAIQVIHQCCHYTGYSNKTFNDLVGKYLSAFVLIDFETYRKSHFKHHKNLGTELDTEILGYEKLNSQSSYKDIFKALLGYTKYKSLFNDFPNTKEASTRIIFNVLIICLISLTAGSNLIAIAWILSLVFVTEPIHFIIEIPEHFDCKKISFEKYENTRTLKNVSLFSRWFTNWNNYHVEHHLNQWVLPESLGKYHNHLMNIKYNQNLNSYSQFYLYFLSSIFNKAKQK